MIEISWLAMSIPPPPIINETDRLPGASAIWERSGSVVECLTRDRRAAGASLTGVTALWSLSKTNLS